MSLEITEEQIAVLITHKNNMAQVFYDLIDEGAEADRFGLTEAKRAELDRRYEVADHNYMAALTAYDQWNFAPVGD